MMNDDGNMLGQMLRAARDNAGLGVPAVAEAVGIDRAYLWRLETQDADWLNRPLGGGPIKQPSRDLVIRLAIALQFDVNATDELLLAAGYAPLSPTAKTEARRVAA